MARDWAVYFPSMKTNKMPQRKIEHDILPQWKREAEQFCFVRNWRRNENGTHKKSIRCHLASLLLLWNMTCHHIHKKIRSKTNKREVALTTKISHKHNKIKEMDNSHREYVWMHFFPWFLNFFNDFGWTNFNSNKTNDNVQCLALDYLFSRFWWWVLFVC